MGRYVYDAGKVSIALDELSDSCDVLKDTQSGMQSGLNTILSARGADLINVGSSAITGYPDEAVSYIEQLMSQISDKAHEIEEYNDTPWYKKLFGTIGMGITKLGEGIATAFEQIGDGVVSVTGFVGGIFDPDFKNSCAEYVKKDHVGDAFAAAYEGDGVMGWINKNSIMSHESTAANVFKGVGVAAGYIAVAVATGGAGAAISGTSVAAGATAAVSNIGLNAAIAGVGGIGSGTQSGLQQGKDFNDAFAQGVKQGAIQAGTVFVAGKIAQKFSAPKTSNSTELAVVDGSSSKAITAAGNTMDDQISAAAKAAGNTMDDQISAVSKASDVFDGAELIKTAGKNGDQAVLRLKDGNLVSISRSSGSTNGLAGGELSNLSSAQIDDIISSASKGAGSTTSKMAAAGTTGTESAGSNATKAIEQFASNNVDDSINAASKASKVTSGVTNVNGKTVYTTNGNSVSQAANIVKENVASTASNMAGKAASTVSNMAGKAASTVSNMAGKAASTVSNVASKAAGGVGTVASKAAGGVGTVATAVATSPTALVMGAMNVVNESKTQVASAQFRSANTPLIKNDTNIQSPVGSVTLNENAASTFQNENDNDNNNKENNTPSENENPTGSTGGGSSSTGGGSSSTGGGSSSTGGGNAVPYQKLDNSSPNKTIIEKTPSTTTPSTPASSTTTPSTQAPSTTTPSTPAPSTTTPSTTVTGDVKPTPSTPTSQTSGVSTPTAGATMGGSTNGYHSTSSGMSGTASGIENLGTNGVESSAETAGNSVSSTISSIIKKGSSVTKIPTSSDPITSSGSSGSSVIPVAAGLAAAAAAGIGAKAYMDHKSNSDNDEEYEEDGVTDGITTEEWNGEDNLSLDYDEGTEKEQYLDSSDDYSYQEEPETDAYEARNSSELASQQ